MWRNGRRDGLKIRCWQQRVGSSPTTGTKTEIISIYFDVVFIFWENNFRDKKSNKFKCSDKTKEVCKLSYNLLINDVKSRISDILNSDNSGHGMDHVNRVLNLSLKFARKENVNEDVVALIALLHDVDDYKLFGSKNAEELTNARSIMNDCKINEEIQNQVLNELQCIGYSKSLKGIRPKAIEGKIVSDADMCDGLGVNGVLRTYAYSLKKGKPFFDKNAFPIENLSAGEYNTTKCAESSINHFFEKILKLKDLMMTDSGKEEAKGRHQIIVDILHHFFEEEDVPEWTEYLNKYLNN